MLARALFPTTGPPFGSLKCARSQASCLALAMALSACGAPYKPVCTVTNQGTSLAASLTQNVALTPLPSGALLVSDNNSETFNVWTIDPNGIASNEQQFALPVIDGQIQSQQTYYTNQAAVLLVVTDILTEDSDGATHTLSQLQIQPLARAGNTTVNASSIAGASCVDCSLNYSAQYFPGQLFIFYIANQTGDSSGSTTNSSTTNKSGAPSYVTLNDQGGIIGGGTVKALSAAQALITDPVTRPDAILTFDGTYVQLLDSTLSAITTRLLLPDPSALVTWQRETSEWAIAWADTSDNVFIERFHFTGNTLSPVERLAAGSVVSAVALSGSEVAVVFSDSDGTFFAGSDGFGHKLGGDLALASDQTGTGNNTVFLAAYDSSHFAYFSADGNGIERFGISCDP